MLSSSVTLYVIITYFLTDHQIINNGFIQSSDTKQKAVHHFCTQLFLNKFF